jgi:membrane protease YdiL (CAAX protease family)
VEETGFIAALRQSGLTRCPPFYRDGLFWLAVLAGIGVALGIGYGPLPVQRPGQVLAPLLLFSVVLWQPLLEEVFFRGIVQGQLLRTAWGGHRLVGISAANLASSALFTALHFVYHPPLWALSVIVPSLVFGFLRERYHSVYPSLVLHSLYNLFYIILVL